MRTLRLPLAGTVILALLGGLGGVAFAQSKSDDGVGVTESPAPTTNEQTPSQEFPTGTFVTAEWGNGVLEFNEDGTGRATETWIHVEFTYAVDGDLYEQTSIIYMGEPEELPPATYRWQFDGEYLTFEVVGEDPDRERSRAYTEQPYRYVPEPRLAVIAAHDIEVGTTLSAAHAKLEVVPAADVPLDTLTDGDSATGATATVAITKGQPITPDMLEPPTE